MAQMFVAAPFFIGAGGPGSARWIPIPRGGATLAPLPPPSSGLAPLARLRLLAGAAMGWARALGEFGATLTFAGNLPGPHADPAAGHLPRPQSDLGAALALSVVLLLFSFALLALPCGASAPTRLGRTSSVLTAASVAARALRARRRAPARARGTRCWSARGAPGKTSELPPAPRADRPRGAGHGGWVGFADAGAGLACPPLAARGPLRAQDYALFPHLSLSEQRRVRARAARLRAGGAPGASRGGARPGRRSGSSPASGPEELSGGERQRVALARALA